MKNKDKQTLDMLRGELAKSSETAKVPLRLQKESMVAMLKNSDGNEKDFSDKTGTKNNIIVLRRMIAAAAVLVVVVIAALVSQTGGVKVIKTDSFYKGYESAQPVQNAKSYEDVEKAVLEILGGKSGETKKPTTADRTDKADSSTNSSTQKVIDRLLEGYSQYVAEANSLGEKPEYTAEASSSDVSAGVVSNGDFKADIVKTDGKYLYIVTTGSDSKTGATVEQIKIVKAVPAEEMQVVSTIVLSNSSADAVNECFEIYLKNNRLIALVNRYSYSLSGTAAYDNISTVAVYYDISDPTAPVKLREHKQEGGYVASGLYENQLYLVTAKSISSVTAKLEESGVIPSFSVDGEKFMLNAEDIFIAVNDPEASYLFITVTDITDLQVPVGKLAILGSGREVYCSAHTIAVARGFVSVDADENGNHSSLTEIYRFNINGSSVAFSGSYIVKGSLSGGISVDETNGYLRAATSGADANNFYVLNENMEFVSGLTGILPNQKIKSVKFVGSNAYFVADDDSEKTMIINLSDPSKPKAAGTISTEGFSQELYAVSDTALLGIGTGDNKSISISLFDVSNPDSPKTASVYTLEGDFSLPSAGDSRCVMINTDEKLFGIPIVKHNPTAGTEISAYILFSVQDGVIAPVGTYNHDTAYTGDAAVRGLCIENTLYTVSGERVVAFSIKDCTVISSQGIR